MTTPQVMFEKKKQSHDIHAEVTWHEDHDINILW